MLHRNIKQGSDGRITEVRINSPRKSIMTKFTAPEQFVEAGKAALETLLLARATSAFARAERLAALNLNTARSVMEDGVANTKALLAVKDPQELVKLQTSLAQLMVDKAVAYARSVYEIAAEGQNEVTAGRSPDRGDQQDREFGSGPGCQVRPAGSEAAFTAAKSAMAAATAPTTASARPPSKLPTWPSQRRRCYQGNRSGSEHQESCLIDSAEAELKHTASAVMPPGSHRAAFFRPS